MKWLIVIIMAALANVPFMLIDTSNWFNFLSFGICAGLAISQTIIMIIER